MVGPARRRHARVAQIIAARKYAVCNGTNAAHDVAFGKTMLFVSSARTLANLEDAREDTVRAGMACFGCSLP